MNKSAHLDDDLFFKCHLNNFKVHLVTYMNILEAARVAKIVCL